MTQVEREHAARVLREFYDFNKTLTPQGDSWLQADITINRYTQEELGKALPTAIAALRGPQPDPITGLVPCGCGGEVYPHYQLGWCHEESGVQAFEVSTGCDGCGTYTKPRRGHYVNGIDEDDTESASKRDWNISHGYTAPPLPGAIGPDAGEMDPNGDEGATYE